MILEKNAQHKYTTIIFMCVCVCAVKIYILFTNETSFVWRCKGEKQKHNSIPTTVTEILQKEPKRERESEWVRKRGIQWRRAWKWNKRDGDKEKQPLAHKNYWTH